MIRPSHWVAFAATIIACGNGNGEGPDGSVDSGDELPVCPEGHPEPVSYLVDSANLDLIGSTTRMSVTLLEPHRIGLEAEALPNGHVPTLAATIPESLPPFPATLSLGDEIDVVIGGCGEGQNYARLRTPVGELIYEGGDPTCNVDHLAYWPEAPIFITVEHVGAETCRLPAAPQCCCATRLERDVVLEQDRAHRIEPGSAVEIAIDGATYLAFTSGAVFQVGSPCETDQTLAYGSVAIVPAP